MSCTTPTCHGKFFFTGILNQKLKTCTSQRRSIWIVFNKYVFKYLDRSCDKGDDTSYPILALYLTYEFNCWSCCIIETFRSTQTVIANPRWGHNTNTSFATNDNYVQKSSIVIQTYIIHEASHSQTGTKSMPCTRARRRTAAQRAHVTQRQVKSPPRWEPHQSMHGFSR